MYNISLMLICFNGKVAVRLYAQRIHNCFCMFTFPLLQIKKLHFGKAFRFTNISVRYVPRFLGHGSERFRTAEKIITKHKIFFVGF